MSFYETVSVQVAIFAMVGTLIAAIVAAVNAKIAKEMVELQKNQFDNLKMPYLVIHDLKYSFRLYNQNDDGEFEDIYEKFYINEEEYDYDNIWGVLTYNKELDIKIENIHNAFAKDVKISVSIPNITHYKELDLFDNKIKFGIDENDYLEIVFEEANENISRYYSIQESKEILVIGGNDNNSNGISSKASIAIPTGFLMLVALMGTYKILNKSDVNIELPKLKVDIECKDILNNNHIFEINIIYSKMGYVLSFDDSVKSFIPEFKIDFKKI